MVNRPRLGALACALALATVACRSRGDRAQPDAHDEREANPTGPARPGPARIDGEPHDPIAANDRPDVLVFVRTDCPISNRYAPRLGRIAARFADRPLDLWLVYVDPDEGPPQIRAHLDAYALPGTPLRDPGQVLAARAEVRVTPEAAVFDAAGTLRYHGRIDDWYVDYGKSRTEPSTAELADAIAAVLDGGTIAHPATQAVGCPLPPLPEAPS